MAALTRMGVMGVHQRWVRFEADMYLVQEGLLRSLGFVLSVLILRCGLRRRCRALAGVGARFRRLAIREKYGRGIGMC